MIGFSARLDDFADVDVNSLDEGLSDTQTSHEDRLSVYEEGYQAGWDDAIRANDAEIKKLRLSLIEKTEAYRTDFDAVYLEVFEITKIALAKIFDTHTEAFVSETISSFEDA